MKIIHVQVQEDVLAAIKVNCANRRITQKEWMLWAIDDALETVERSNGQKAASAPKKDKPKDRAVARGEKSSKRLTAEQLGKHNNC